MKKLFPAILAIFGLALGTGGGMYLKHQNDLVLAEEAASIELVTPETDEVDAKAVTEPLGPDTPIRRSARDDDDKKETYEYVKLNNQFIVPVVNGEKISALVVMSLSIEVVVGKKEAVFVREPKLRDAFLQVLFAHANSGGFDGVFTTGEKMNDLRGSLYEVAVEILGPTASDVLVIDIVRQDV